MTPNRWSLPIATLFLVTLFLTASSGFAQDDSDPRERESPDEAYEELPEESGYSYTMESKNRDFIFVMIAPDEREADAEDLAEGLVSEVRQRYSRSGLYKKGAPKKPLWIVDWFAPSVYISNDGIHMIRQGVKSETVDDEAMTFFAHGTEIKRISIRDVVASPFLLETLKGSLNWRFRDKFDAEAGTYHLSTRFRESYLFNLNGELQESSRSMSLLGPVLAGLAAFLWVLAFVSQRPIGPWLKDGAPRQGGAVHILVNGGVSVAMILALTWARFLPVNAEFDEWGFMRICLIASVILTVLPFTLVLRKLDARLSPAAVAATPWLHAGAWTTVAGLIMTSGLFGLAPTSHLKLVWVLGAAAGLGAWIGLLLSQTRTSSESGKKGAFLAHTIGAIGLIGAINLIYALVMRVLGYLVIGISNGPSWQSEEVANKILDEGLAFGLIYALVLVVGLRSFGLRDRRAAFQSDASSQATKLPIEN